MFPQTLFWPWVSWHKACLWPGPPKCPGDNSSGSPLSGEPGLAWLGRAWVRTGHGAKQPLLHGAGYAWQDPVLTLQQMPHVSEGRALVSWGKDWVPHRISVRSDRQLGRILSLVPPHTGRQSAPSCPRLAPSSFCSPGCPPSSRRPSPTPR